MTDTTLSQAIKEAYASAPSDDIIYHTLEIWHENFTQPIYVVRDYADLEATIESGAARNAGLSVTFIRFAFEIVPPEVDKGGVPQCIIELDNVSRDIVANIELARGSSSTITMIYRAYLSSDLSGPENDPPLELSILSITADPFKVRAVAGFSSLANLKFPKQEYSAEVFPGLAPLAIGLKNILVNLGCRLKTTAGLLLDGFGSNNFNSMFQQSMLTRIHKWLA